VQEVGTLRRNVEANVEARQPLEAADMRTGIQVPDGADANRGHVGVT
jgi:hypothetical protein